MQMGICGLELFGFRTFWRVEGEQTSMEEEFWGRREAKVALDCLRKVPRVSHQCKQMLFSLWAEDLWHASLCFAWKKHAGFMGSFKIWFLKPKRQVENEAGEISRLEHLQTYRKTGNVIFFSKWQCGTWQLWESFSPLQTSHKLSVGLAQVRRTIILILKDTGTCFNVPAIFLTFFFDCKT